MTRLFISGISGLLGLNAAMRLRERYHVSGAYRSHPVVLDGVDAVSQDLLDAEGLLAVCRRVRPDVVIHTAGLTSVDGCERDPEMARRLHEDATRHMLAAAAAVGAGFIHISTDHLFSGAEPLLDENAPPVPLNVYARTKLAAEHLVAGASLDALIVRTNFYGWGTSQRSSLTDWILQALRAGKPREMFTDVFFTPIQINDLVDDLVELWDRGLRGVVNVVGGERLSKFDFGVHVADQFGFDRRLIVPRSVERFPFAAPRPRDMSLASGRAAAALGRPMPDAPAGLARLARELAAGLPASLERAVRVPARAPQ